MDRRLKSGSHDVETARKYYSAMRNLIINHRGGSRDQRTLEKLGDLSRKAAAAIDDSDCKRLLSAVDGYAADLFSESGHLKWARAEMPGAHFLRLQILRELDAFHARLLQLQFETTRNAAAVAGVKYGFPVAAVLPYDGSQGKRRDIPEGQTA